MCGVVCWGTGRGNVGGRCHGAVSVKGTRNAPPRSAVGEPPPIKASLGPGLCWPPVGKCGLTVKPRSLQLQVSPAYLHADDCVGSTTSFLSL
jgi:hypothetical protein